MSQDLWIHQGLISREPIAGARTIVTDGWIVPGLVDAHAHLALASPAGDDADEATRIQSSLELHRDRGVLAVREPGGPSRRSANFVGANELPRLVTAGQFLAPPGRYFPGLARDAAESELAVAAADEVMHSAGWIKVVGDFIGDDGRFTPNYSTTALIEARDRAHALGAKLAVHVMSRAGMDVVVPAGVDSIEHGHGITVDHLKEMQRLGTVFVPTLTIVPVVQGMIDQMGVSGDQVTEARAAMEKLPALVLKAHELGVRVLAGTDAGMVPHGVVAQEIMNLNRAGLPTDVALGAGSWLSREYLGFNGLEDGAPADLVVFSSDPRQDLAVLNHPVAIVLGGRLLST